MKTKCEFNSILSGDKIIENIGISNPNPKSSKKRDSKVNKKKTINNFFCLSEIHE